MSILHWWNDTNRGLPNYCKKKLFAFHFVHLKSHVDSLVSIANLGGDRPKNNCLSDGTAAS
jgi:hypothetical protein